VIVSDASLVIVSDAWPEREPLVHRPKSRGVPRGENTRAVHRAEISTRAVYLAVHRAEISTRTLHTPRGYQGLHPG
jgi:hypothetical protein